MLTTKDGARDGRYRAGASSDDFADLHFWNTADYEAQWRKASLDSLPGMLRVRLCLTSRPGCGIPLMWPMWRVGNTVFVQERRVLDDTIIGSGVSGSSMLDVVVAPWTRNEHGAPIREWAVHFADMLSFLADA